MTTPSIYNHEGKHPYTAVSIDDAAELSLGAAGKADATNGYTAAFPATIKDATTGIVAKYLGSTMASQKLSRSIEVLISYTYDDNFTQVSAATRLDDLDTTLAKVKASPATGEIALEDWKIAILAATRFNKSNLVYEKKIITAAFTDLLTRDFTVAPATAATRQRRFEFIEAWTMYYPAEAYEVFSTVLKGLGSAFTLPADQTKYDTSQKLLETALRYRSINNPGVEPVIAYDLTSPATAVSTQFNALLATSVIKLSYDGTFQWYVTKPLDRFKGLIAFKTAADWNAYFNSTAYTPKNYYTTTTQKHTERVTQAKTLGGLTDEQILDLLINLETQFPRTPLDANVNNLSAARWPGNFNKAEDGLIEFAKRELAMVKFKEICSKLKGLGSNTKFAAKLINLHDKHTSLYTAFTAAQTAYNTALSAVTTAETTYNSTPTDANKTALNNAVYVADAVAKDFIKASEQVKDYVWQQILTADQTGEVKLEADIFPVEQAIYLFAVAGITPDGMPALGAHSDIMAKFPNAVTPANNDLQAIINLLSKFMPKQVEDATNRLPTTGMDSTVVTNLIANNDTIVAGPNLSTVPPIQIVQDFLTQGLTPKEAYMRAIEAYTYNPLNPLAMTSDQKDRAEEILEALFETSLVDMATKKELYMGPTTTDPLVKQRQLVTRFGASDLAQVVVSKKFADNSTATVPNSCLSVMTDFVHASTTTVSQFIELLEKFNEQSWPVWKQVIVTNNNTLKLPIAPLVSVVERALAVLVMADSDVNAVVANSTKAKARANEIISDMLGAFSKDVAKSIWDAIRKFSNAQLAEVVTGTITRKDVLSNLMDNAISAYAKTTGLTGTVYNTWLTGLIPATAPTTLTATTHAEGFVVAKKALGLSTQKVLTLNPTLFTSAERTTLGTSITNSGVTSSEITQIDTDMGNAAIREDNYFRTIFAPKFV
ncbi:MAG: hypothetical protein K0S74_409 [Chlamydiales bacterium]|jgi:hypothetical protein|nr:hypothetical protein [Chlamydiales bacterium]